ADWNNQRPVDLENFASSQNTLTAAPTNEIQQLKSVAPLLKHSGDRTIQKILDAYNNNTLTQLAKDKNFHPKVDLNNTGKTKRLESSADKTRFLSQVIADWNNQRPVDLENFASSQNTLTAAPTNEIQQLKSVAPLLKHS
ncbi:hypothetical protein, partial [Nocardiopsis ansamitocini]|uniref:hypothetical protein n=1 Tax=Nocardiopsis ansamitocini TaxID=1670832 RepID=UPI002555BC0E